MPTTYPRPGQISRRLLAVAALAGTAYWWGCSQSGDSMFELTDGVKHPSVGTAIDVVQLEPLTGTDQPLVPADYAGKVSLVNFWGPWCGPCVVEFPHLVELQQHFGKRDDFRLVSVSCSGGDGDDRMMEESTSLFLREQRATFPTYRDPDYAFRSSLAKAASLQGFGYPTTVLIGKDGKIKALWTGYIDGLELDMRAAIEAALSEEPPKTASL